MYKTYFNDITVILCLKRLLLCQLLVNYCYNLYYSHKNNKNTFWRNVLFLQVCNLLTFYTTYPLLVTGSQFQLAGYIMDTSSVHRRYTTQDKQSETQIGNFSRFTALVCQLLPHKLYIQIAHLI